MPAQTEFFIISSKLIECIFSDDTVCSNPFVEPLPRIKISFLLLSIFVHGLISTPKIITFLPVLPLGCEKNYFPLNPTPYPEYLYLSISAFSVDVTASDKHFSRITWITAYVIIFTYLINNVNFATLP